MIEKDKEIQTNPVIKHKDLNGAMRGCNDHINKLLKTSLKHYDDKNYPQCIVDSVLAFEEITKFGIYAKYQRELKDISKSTVKKIEEHGHKLTIWIEDERLREIYILENKKNINKNDKIKNEDQINKSAEKDKKLFIKFDKIKQLGMYSDFVKGQTISLDEHFMKTEITQNNLQVFSNYFFRYVNYRFFLETLRLQCGNIMGIIDKNSECVKKNGNYQYIIEYQDYLESPEHDFAYRRFLRITSELEHLVDYLKNIK